VGIYFVVFRFLILKFDFKTPGREDESDEIEFKSKADYRRQQEERGGKAASAVAAKEERVSKNAILAENVLDLLGGKDNIKDVANCATRLRVNVHDETLVASDADFKAVGTSGVSKNGKSMQVIIGLKVAMVREEFEQLL